MKLYMEMPGFLSPKYGKKYSMLLLVIKMIVNMQVEVGGFILYFVLNKLSKSYPDMIFRA